MKHSKAFLVGVLLIVAAALLFQAGKASATTGCFSDTNGHPFETFICWLKDNGITGGFADGTFRPELSISRGQMAVFLQRSVDIPPSVGNILVAGGMGSWQVMTSPTSLNFTRYSGSLYISRPSTGAEFILLTPDTPTVLYGRSLQLVGVEFCYEASANVLLDYVEINTTSASIDEGDRTLRFADNTDRSDSTCRYYVLSTPVTLNSESGSVSFYALLNWVTPSSTFKVGRTTFVFQPTTSVPPPPAIRPGALVTPLQEGGPSTVPVAP